MFNYQKLIHKLLVSQFLVAVDLALLNMHEHTCLRLLVLSPMFDIWNPCSCETKLSNTQNTAR